MKQEKAEKTAKDESFLYELGYHLLPTVPEDQVAEKVEAIKKLIEGNGGTVITEGAPVPTELAYTMDKVIANKHNRFDSSYFGWMKFSVEEKQGVVALKEAIDQDNDVLRYILIKATAVAPAQKTILRETKAESKTISAPRKEEESAEVSEKELEESIEKLGV